jgi:hypothetical protein
MVLVIFHRPTLTFGNSLSDGAPSDGADAIDGWSNVMAEDMSTAVASPATIRNV